MEMSQSQGGLIGAGDGPFHKDLCNTELMADVSWRGVSKDTVSGSFGIGVDPTSGAVRTRESTSRECSLMINLYGSHGNPGSVLRIHAKGRKGEQKSFPECIRLALLKVYGEDRCISLEGTFVISTGRSCWHIMPEFPPESEMPFKSFKQLNDWLSYHTFDSPMVCCSVLHSSDPGGQMGLRLEHTHGYGRREGGHGVGGHYHADVESQEVEYEAYFNTAKTVYRIARPEVSLGQDLHD